MLWPHIICVGTKKLCMNTSNRWRQTETRTFVLRLCEGMCFSIPGPQKKTRPSVATIYFHSTSLTKETFTHANMSDSLIIHNVYKYLRKDNDMTASFILFLLDSRYFLCFIATVFVSFCFVAKQPIRVRSFTNGQYQFYILNWANPMWARREVHHTH